jgi:predicted PurR-regulated permease PerM
MTRSTRLRLSFFYILLGGVALLTFAVFRPYAVTLSLAAALAVVSRPIYHAMLRIVRRQQSIAALLTVIVMAILVLAPLSLLTMQVVREATTLYERINTAEAFDGAFLGTIETTVERYVQAYLPEFTLDLGTFSRQALRWLTGYLGPFFANTLYLFLHISLGLVAFFYFIRDGASFVESFNAISPLTAKDDAIIMERLTASINSIIKGFLLIALLEGIASGIGFKLFGLPSATLWGSFVAVAALLPGVGPSLIILPAVLYLYLTGNTFAAVGLAIWGIVTVSSIDNFLGPILVGRGVRIHPLFILFAVIGGVHLFGPPGFLLGPLILSLFFALIDIFKVIQTEKSR